MTRKKAESIFDAYLQEDMEKIMINTQSFLDLCDNEYQMNAFLLAFIINFHQSDMGGHPTELITNLPNEIIHLILDALDTVDADDVRVFFLKMIHLFPDGELPDDIEEKIRFIENIGEVDDSFEDIITELELEFNDLFTDSLKKKIIAYIEANIDRFEN